MAVFPLWTHVFAHIMICCNSVYLIWTSLLVFDVEAGGRMSRTAWACHVRLPSSFA